MLSKWLGMSSRESIFHIESQANKVLACLLLLFSVVPFAQNCTTLGIHPPSGSDASFCIREATFLRAKGLIVLDNGTCFITKACSPTSADLPMFMRVRQLPLLRVRVASGTDPYLLLKNGTANQSEFESLEGSPHFKSPLLSRPADLLSHIRVQMLNRTSKGTEVHAELRFRVDKGEILTKGAWFSVTRLHAANPWSSSLMKTYNYSYFSVEGMEWPSTVRRFYISMINRGCDTTAGYMMTLTYKSRTLCTWEKIEGKNLDGRFMWAEHLKRYGNWKSEARDAQEFRLVGDLHPSAVVYVRI